MVAEHEKRPRKRFIGARGPACPVRAPSPSPAQEPEGGAILDVDVAVLKPVHINMICLTGGRHISLPAVMKGVFGSASAPTVDPEFLQCSPRARFSRNGVDRGTIRPGGGFEQTARPRRELGGAPSSAVAASRAGGAAAASGGSVTCALRSDPICFRPQFPVFSTTPSSSFSAQVLPSTSTSAGSATSASSPSSSTAYTPATSSTSNPKWVQDAIGRPCSSAFVGGKSASCSARGAAGTGLPPRRRRRARATEIRRDPLDPEYFFKFLVEREEVRIRREALKQPAEQWYSNQDYRWMKSTKLTNVRREDDRTTREMRKLCQTVCEEWICSASHRRHELGSYLVFNYGLWRAFGTADFATEVGFLQDVHSFEEVICRVVEAGVRVWERGKSCFTDAYRPAAFCCSAEKKRRAEQDVDGVRALCRRVCQELQPLWEASGRIAKVSLDTRSWEQAMEVLMEVRRFGGTGFIAKELMQDLMHSPLFQDWDEKAERWQSTCGDINTFCVVGPGARRGLNRLHGRCLGHLIYKGGLDAQKFFLKELLQLFHEVRGAWPKEILGTEVRELELHDIQFQLCEFDKHERAKYSDGHARVYKPPGRDYWPKVQPMKVQPIQAPSCAIVPDGYEHLPPRKRPRLSVEASPSLLSGPSALSLSLGAPPLPSSEPPPHLFNILRMSNVTVQQPVVGPRTQLVSRSVVAAGPRSPPGSLVRRESTQTLAKRTRVRKSAPKPDPLKWLHHFLDGLLKPK